MRQARRQPHGTLHDAGERADDGPVMVIDTYLPKPGLRAAFIAQLAEEIHGAQRPVHGGAFGSRVYRTLDGEAVVVVTEFASHAEKLRWRAGEAFTSQLQQLRPLLEHALSRTCEPVSADAASVRVAAAAEMAV